MTHELISPGSADHWRNYHEIRRTVLWEARGNFGVYDDKHPDEHKHNHFPKLLLHDSAAIGVIRIDLHGQAAWFRRVAIKEDLQRNGHGRALLALAENFARQNGADSIESSVDEDAAPFYRKCGYTSHEGALPTAMYKLINE